MRRKASEKVRLYGQPLTENKRGQEAKKEKRKRKERRLNLCANRKWFSFGNGSTLPTDREGQFVRCGQIN